MYPWEETEDVEKEIYCSVTKCYTVCLILVLLLCIAVFYCTKAPQLTSSASDLKIYVLDLL